jgi:hypothetical protein
LVCLLIALTLASCGGSDKPPVQRAQTTTADATTTPTARAQAHTFVPPPANAIVYMRRFSPVSLMWQTIFVQPNGRGLLTSLIGETAGAPHRAFRLSASELVALRRLLAAARAVKPGPSKAGPYLYSLHIAGEAPFSMEGPIPTRLNHLVNYLGDLMLNYCC